MRMPRYALAFFVLAGLTAPAGGARDPGPQVLIRDLQQLQDRIAQGDLQAADQRASLRAEIERQLEGDALPENRGELDKHLQTALVLALNGGAAGFILDELRRGEDRLGNEKHPRRPADSKRLVQGVYAYSQGRSAEAASALLGLDVHNLPPTLARHLVLVQGFLSMTYDPKRAAAYFDKARLLAPGTFIEEAALRHQAMLASSSGDRAGFTALSSAYFRRFPRSIFAESFAGSFATAITRKSSPVSSLSSERVKSLLNNLAGEMRARAYLQIAERAVLAGQPRLALFSAEEAGKLLHPDSTDYQRSVLFRGMALAITETEGEFQAALAPVNGAKLAAADAALLNAARSVNRAIHSEPAPQASAQMWPADQVASALIKRADGKLAEIDRLLGVAEGAEREGVTR